MLLVLVILLVITILFAYLAHHYNQEFRRSRGQASSLKARYGAIANVEEELAKAQARLAQMQRSEAEFDAEAQERRSTLNQQYEQAQGVYRQLKKEVTLLEENLEDISFGVYKPHFSFQTPEAYKQELEQYRWPDLWPTALEVTR
jgi:DNA repair exonuclease SbcCD ATPase subunit